MELNLDALIGQFVLSKSEHDISASWNTRQQCDWFLGSHVRLPVVDICASDGTVIGWLLGHAISPDGQLVSNEESVCFSVDQNSSEASDQFEAALYAHAGRFAAIFLANEHARLYLDPCGSLATVFCPAQKIVASTPSLIPYVNGQDDNHELIRSIVVPSKDTYYPFGLTPRYSVERLLPNHFLDLRSWKAVRHWPVGDLSPVEDVESAVTEIVSILKNNISAIACGSPVYMGLTAGRDSRMLLACSRDFLDRVSFFTVLVPHAGGRLDRQITSKMAKQHCLNHVFLPFVRASEAQANEFLYRTGNCVYGLYSQIDLAYRHLELKSPILVGACGELGRGYHWRSGDVETSPIVAEDLLIKRDIPITTETRDRAQQWLDALPVKNSLTIWGLHYNELFNGCWFGPLLYGCVNNAFFLFPFSHRRIIELMLTLPTEYRRANSLSSDIVTKLWPELLDLPFNWFMGFQRYVYGVSWRWSRLRKQLSSMLKR